MLVKIMRVVGALPQFVKLGSDVGMIDSTEPSADPFRVGLVGLMVRFAGAGFEPDKAFLFVAAFPFVVRLTADAVVAAGGRVIPAGFFDVPQHGVFVFRSTLEFSL